MVEAGEPHQVLSRVWGWGCLNGLSRIHDKTGQCRDGHGSPKVRCTWKRVQDSLSRVQSMRESLSQVAHHLHQKTSFSCLLGYLQILVGLFWFKATHTQLLEGCGRSGCLTHTGFQKSVRVPAACLPKASKQARLVYRKVSFISDISY